MVDELNSFKDFSLALGMLSAIANVANFAKIYQKFAKIYSKTISLRNF